MNLLRLSVFLLLVGCVPPTKPGRPSATASMQPKGGENSLHSLMSAHAPRSSGTFTPVRSTKPPAGFGRPDKTITITTVQGQLAYAETEFSVPPGAKIKLVLVNPDQMQHNLVICKPGAKSAEEIGLAAMLLGGRALEMHYVPDHPKTPSPLDSGRLVA